MYPAVRFSPELYDELRRLAAQMLHYEEPATLEPTALVHEALLRLHPCTSRDPNMANKRYFFASASEAMRRILIEQARKRKAEKHGGCMIRVPFEQADIPDDSAFDLEGLSEALDLLEQHDPEAAELVRLRFFVGLTMQEAAEVMEQSLRSTERLWAYAKTWLFEKLHESDQNVGGR
jgi:RNA polymerase sigma factor (TIGR02999 family)